MAPCEIQTMTLAEAIMRGRKGEVNISNICNFNLCAIKLHKNWYTDGKLKNKILYLRKQWADLDVTLFFWT